MPQPFGLKTSTKRASRKDQLRPAAVSATTGMANGSTQHAPQTTATPVLVTAAARVIRLMPSPAALASFVLGADRARSQAQGVTDNVIAEPGTVWWRQATSSLEARS